MSSTDTLLVLLAALEVHPQTDGEASRPGLRRRTVGIDDVERGPGVTAASAAAASTTASAARSIEQLRLVGADDVVGDAGEELRGAPLAQAIAVQRVPLHVEHRARAAGAHARVLGLADARHREDALRQAVGIDAHLHGGRLRAIGSDGRAASLSGATRPAARSTAAPTRGAATTRTNAGIFVAFRQERRRLVLAEYGEVQPERLRPVVRRHIEPLRSEPEVGGREKPEVLAAGVPRGPHRVGEAVRHLDALTRLHVRGHDDAVHRRKAAGECNPLRVRTPARIEGALGHHPLVAANDLCLSARDVEHPHVEIRVGIQQLRRVR
jgi:hypothetical protein